MKIKYLKKLRKRYSWKWKPDSMHLKSGTWVILDHKKKEVIHWYNAHNFISYTLFDVEACKFNHRQRERAYEFNHRQRERAKILKYKEQLKEFKL